MQVYIFSAVVGAIVVGAMAWVYAVDRWVWCTIAVGAMAWVCAVDRWVWCAIVAGAMAWVYAVDRWGCDVQDCWLLL